MAVYNSTLYKQLLSQNTKIKNLKSISKKSDIVNSDYLREDPVCRLSVHNSVHDFLSPQMQT